MEPEKTPRKRAEDLISLLVSDWRPSPWHVVWAIRIVLATVVVLGLLTLVGRPFGITLWDWLKLLVVPAVIAGGGIWFNRQQRERELEIAERRTQDEALQAYLDQMSGMLIPNTDQPSLFKARPGDSLSSVARARTLTVLPRLDGERKGRVMQFLYESGLVAKARPVLDLQGADLGGADLRSADLEEADLRATNLSEADLSGAHLSGADLRTTNLRGANLSGAGLSQANLFAADLREADLVPVDLSNAFLIAANLSGTNLKLAVLVGANLMGANLSDTNLSEAFLTGATMPNGQILKGDRNPDGPTFEEWLKSKGQESDGKNE